jgi:cellulose synthase/poly-beta-1,6-N-acetylglucosamine synthase-like glycosyltransferase
MPMTILFWACVATVFYTYAGYPLLVWAAGKLLDRSVRRVPACPRVSVIVAAYNEAEGIESRLRNVLRSAYAHDRLEVVVVSDGSTDDTVELARAIDPRRVRVLALPRCGKAAALSAGVQVARGDILVFTDANTVFDQDAVAALVMNFGDESVGGVVGRTGYVMDENTEAAGRGEQLYWNYDTWLKQLESRTGSVVSAHGGMYAIRRDLFEPVSDPAVTDDFAISTAVVARGKRLVFEPEAYGFELPMTTSGSEFSRRVRLMTRGLRGVVVRRALLNPFRYGFYSVALWSRKVLRRLVPLTFPPLLVSSWLLAADWWGYAVVAGSLAAVIGLGALGAVLRSHPLGRMPALYAPFFFCGANAAAAIALWNVARGRRIERWTPQRHGAPIRVTLAPPSEARAQ